MIILSPGVSAYMSGFYKSMPCPFNIARHALSAGRPRAIWNLFSHFSDWLNMEMQSSAEGAPSSGSAPPSRRVCQLVVSTSPTCRPGKTYPNDCVLHFEHGASKWALPPVIQAVRVCAVIQQQFDKAGVPMICGEHELSDEHTQRSAMSQPAAKSQHTSVSPFSLVMFAGSPAESARSKTATCPWRAALYMRLANSRAAGGMSGTAIIVCTRFFDTFSAGSFDI